jgi:uncharacterized membrane protein (UPF0136 family)
MEKRRNINIGLLIIIGAVTGLLLKNVRIGLIIGLAVGLLAGSLAGGRK